MKDVDDTLKSRSIDLLSHIATPKNVDIVTLKLIEYVSNVSINENRRTLIAIKSNLKKLNEQL